MKKPQIKKLDKLWSETVKIKAGFKCEKCGSREHLQSHHIFGRRAYSTRWDIDNGICLCPSDHKFSPRFSAHETPTIFTEWIIKERGQDWYDKLRRKFKSIEKREFEDVYEELMDVRDMLTKRQGIENTD